MSTIRTLEIDLAPGESVEVLIYHDGQLVPARIHAPSFSIGAPIPVPVIMPGPALVPIMVEVPKSEGPAASASPPTTSTPTIRFPGRNSHIALVKEAGESVDLADMLSHIGDVQILMPELSAGPRPGKSPLTGISPTQSVIVVNGDLNAFPS